jgi:cellulose 1,4-beta-cellobiosidase
MNAIPGNRQVALSWTAPAGANYYTIQRSTLVANGGGTNITLSTITLTNNVTGTTYTDTSPTNGSIYSYQVMASNAGGTSASSTAATTTPVAAIAAGQP